MVLRFSALAIVFLVASIPHSWAMQGTDACGAGDRPPCVDISGFAVSLFSELCSHQERGNVLISPLSVAQALALAAAGATDASDCQREILGALGVQSHEDLPRLSSAIVPPGTENANGVELTAARSVWTKGVRAEFTSLARAVHSSVARDLPMTYEPLNGWIEDATDGVISDMFDGDEEVDKLTRAFLVSAVHFRGSWTHKFDESKTTDGIFHALADANGGGSALIGEEVPARFMNARRRMAVRDRHKDLGNASVLRLDYGASPPDREGGLSGAGDFCALLILPADPSADSMAQAINGLASTSLSEIAGSVFPREVILSLPRFRVEWGTASLAPSLRAMGINTAFDGKDAFSVMSDDPDVHLSEVLHKSVMEVTEEGTTASAATVGVIMSRSLPPPPMELMFDRPFLMAVMHAPTGTPLFLGKLTKPDLLFNVVQ